MSATRRRPGRRRLAAPRRGRGRAAAAIAALSLVIGGCAGDERRTPPGTSADDVSVAPAVTAVAIPTLERAEPVRSTLAEAAVADGAVAPPRDGNAVGGGVASEGYFGVTAGSPEALVARRLSELLTRVVTLDVETRRARDGWLYVDGLPRDAAGERIDYTDTRFADDVAEGLFDDGFVALLRRSAPGEGWTVLELELGATDAPFVDWEARHGAPAGLVVPIRR